MSVTPQRTSTRADIQRKVQKLGTKWSEDPQKNLKQLQRLTRELENQMSAKDSDKLFGTNKKYTKEDIRDARKWFRDEVKRLLSNPMEIDHKRMSKYTRGQKPISLPHPTDIGKMFFYRYDPKHKDTLPYYDIFPLIIMVNTLKDGWQGLNLHYLPPKHREILISRLMEHMSDSRLDNNTRLKLNYQLLKGVSKYRYFKPCFKRYLVSHTKTTVRSVPFRHWPKAILLPTAKFRKASVSSVWADSRRIMTGGK